MRRNADANLSVFFKDLQTNQFRNLQSEKILFSPHVNLFFGQNGHGKSNLLEALVLSVNAQSFRPVEKVSLLNRSIHTQVDARARLDLTVDREGMISKIETIFSKTQRRTTLNGKSATGSYLAHRFPVVVFSPDSLSAIKQGPELRRQLIDDFLTTTSLENEKIMDEFRKLLRTRNQLLKNLAINPRDTSARDVLEGVSELFFEAASVFTLARQEALINLQPRIGEVLISFFGGRGEDFEARYLISGEARTGQTLEEIRNALRQRASELKDAEIAKGTSLVGPHKHDLQFHWRGANSRFFSSQGQQRSMILAFKMAQILYHFEVFREYPVLLLDDVLSELDEQRRVQLMEFLERLSSQIFLSATDLDIHRGFSKKNVTRYSVVDGRISPVA